MQIKTRALSPLDQREMNFAMRLSFIVGVILLFIKTYAYSITDSTAILADAAESIVHIFAVGFATYSMWFSLRPADEDHPYGHEKISFFSAGFEGAVILIASLFIFFESIYKIRYGITIENINIGLLFILLSITINLFLGLYLIRKGRKYKSIILEANGKHIMTDCWTSTGVVFALVLVKLTGILLFDPLIALVTAVNILWTGGKLIKRSVSGLMDQTDPHLHRQIVEVIQKQTNIKNLKFHNLRHRLSGHKVFIEFHLLFPEEVSLKQAHEMASDLESSIRSFLDRDSEITTHLEPLQDHDGVHQKFGLIG